MLPRALRRLPKESYAGTRTYFLTFLTKGRAPFFVDEAVVTLCDAQFQRAASQTHFSVLAYCYMPDHLHFLTYGKTNDADLLAFVKLARQLSGYHVKRQHRIELWARKYHDRIVREDEDPRQYALYIWNNPVVAKLVDDPADYPFLYIDPTCWPSL